MDFREVFGASYKFKESLWEELQVNVNCIWKVLVVNSFLDNYSRTVFAENIRILSIFMKNVSDSYLNVNNIDKVVTNFFLDYVSKWTCFHLLSG